MKYLRFVGMVLFCSVFGMSGELASGNRVAFLGDSITGAGWQYPTGYVRLCEAAFRANGLQIDIVPAGKGGDRAADMLARFDRAVLARTPTHLVLSCGVNDVWQEHRSTPLVKFERDVAAMIDRAQQAGIKVTVMTATPIYEDLSLKSNQRLDAYNAVLRRLARDKSCLLADQNAACAAVLRAQRPAPRADSRLLTIDGVHMDYPGDRVMAVTLLKTWGFNAEELARAGRAFDELPYRFLVADSSVRISAAEYRKLKAAAAQKHTTVSRYLEQPFAVALRRAVENELKKP